MGVYGEGIFGTRPWKVAGEGPTKSDTLFAFLLGWPPDRRALITSLASPSSLLSGRKVADVSLLGGTGRVEWTQNAQGLAAQLPATPPSEHAVALRIKGVLK
jgi:alpha-L-fucosidase